jgi:hypothetical protein
MNLDIYLTEYQKYTYNIFNIVYLKFIFELILVMIIQF